MAIDPRLSLDLPTEPCDLMDAGSLPSGTVTFLLTDVEGSTRLWERDAAVAAAVVPRHRELLGEAIEACGGARPLEQGEGDNVVAAFARATDAVRAAHAAQVALAREPWPEGGAVRVRMAVHTGEVEAQADGTYAGAVLNRCARLRSLAHGGQVLVSGATADLVADGLDDGLGLVDLGAHRLRDLSRPERVWQLDGPGLEREHPPLRSLDSVPNNLPVQLSSFVGRDDDIAQGVRLLGESRLLTLTGAGGCGKTRLAQRVAGEVSDRFPGGTWWVELAPISDPDLVGDLVVSVVGARPAADRSPVEVLVDAISGFPTLLILDNCEHLVAGAAALADQLLRACADVSVLATSREPLVVEGEVTWRVPSLGLPPDAETEPAALEQYDAVRLFIDRATQVRPNFRVDNDNAPAVAQICHRLDGIPLAIELAAARTRSLPADRIAAALDDRFRLLSGGSRVALPRQQTLYASVDWSHELLDPSERALLRRLAIFTGGFELDAAESVAVGAPLDQYDVLEVLTRLVDKSLVQAEDAGASSSRHHLLETIRQYSLDRLVESGEEAAVRDRHLDWVIAHVGAHEDGARNAHVDALDALEREHANIRAAIDWALASRPDDGLRLVASLAMFWAQRGHYALAGSVYGRALALEAAPALRARARWANAYIRFYGDDVLAALDEAAGALEDARAAHDPGTAALCLHTLGSAMFLADPVAAREMLTESRALAVETGDLWCEADAFQMSAYAYLVEGSFAEALPLLDEGIVLSRAAANPFQEGWYLLGHGYVAAFTGDVETGLRLADEGQAVGAAVGDPSVENFGITLRGYILAALGRTDELDPVLALLRVPGKDWGLLGSGRIAVVEAHRLSFDDPAAGAAALAATADAFMEGGIVCEAATHWAAAALLAAEIGDEATARRALDGALPLDAFFQARPVALLAEALLRRRSGAAGAEDLAHEALSIIAERRFALVLPRVLALVGALALDAGAALEGTRLLAAADAIDAALARRRSAAEQERFDADVRTARTALGDPFDAAWADGAALSPPDAIAYARRARGERGRPSFGWAALTPTEVQVVDLVVEGLTNPQIAERLMMGRETVKTHVGHIFTKLGVANRTELAVLGAEHAAAGLA